MTGLTQADLDKGEPIVQGLRRFMQWCGPDAEFAEWGLDDVPVLKQNLFLCNLDESKPPPCGTTCSRSFCGSIPARKVRA